jgi:hypothetical protein
MAQLARYSRLRRVAERLGATADAIDAHLFDRMVFAAASDTPRPLTDRQLRADAAQHCVLCATWATGSRQTGKRLAAHASIRCY